MEDMNIPLYILLQLLYLYSARIYRPAFSWTQAQNARIQSLKTSFLGLFSRKLCL